MREPRDPVKHRLSKLQRTMRTRTKPNTPHPPFSRRVPEDIANDLHLQLTGSEFSQLKDLLLALLRDPRYEHLFRVVFGRVNEDQGQNAVWRFISLCYVDKTTDHVPWFIRTYSNEPKEARFFFSVESLRVNEEYEVGGATLMAPGAFAPLERQFMPFPPEGSGAIITVQVSGTEPGSMLLRARAKVDHVIRLLRVGLRVHHSITDEQLRFRIGYSYVADDGGAGWESPPDVAWELAVSEAIADSVRKQPLGSLPEVGRNEIERRGLIALEWFDRARLSGDDLIRTLFNFFGIEALLGDSQEKNKGAAIAFRRAVLSEAVREHPRHPSITYSLYDEVRSAAVHGSAPPTLSRIEYQLFNSDSWRTLNEFLTFAKELRLASRAAVIAALESQPSARDLLKRLRAEDPRWKSFKLRMVNTHTRSEGGPKP